MDEPREGDTYTYERTFTAEDVRCFADLSGDQQAIHTEPDEHGRLVVQGLLTATLPTKIGGDLAVLARSLNYEFYEPVYTGERIVCTWTTDAVEERNDRFELSATAICRDDRDDVVMRASVDGLIWK